VIATFSGVYTYIAAVTPHKTRATRMTLVEAVMIIGKSIILSNLDLNYAHLNSSSTTC
jgi:hypothetical protein